ncbi:MAG TPA: hypothetical protein VEU08_14585 [Vicinamibacterales bacterium]|nr:hypothetical protein [Vicinamibacterales bacterium]
MTAVLDVPLVRTVIWPDPPLRSSRVAIVGFATESRYGVPYDDPDVEVWGLNMCEGWMLLEPEAPGRLDRMWELHDRGTLEQESAEEKRSVDHLAWLKANRTIPVYMTDVQPDIPMSRRMPIEHLKTFLGPLCEKLAATPYYTSTFAFMLATAVLGIVQRRVDRSQPEPGEEIIVAGVEMLNGEEYAYQRSCAEFWCGFVLGHGIKLSIPSRSALLESDGLYGYARPESLELLVRMRAYYADMKAKALAKKDEAIARRNQAMSDVQTYDGAAQGVDKILNHLTYLIRGGKV